MALVVVDTGELAFLSYIVNADDLIYKLYTNDVTPNETHTTTDYTECAVSGYTDMTMSGTDWVCTVNPITHADVTHTFATNTTLHGYFVTDNTEATLLYAERFASVMNIPAGGGKVVLGPRLSAS